MICKLQSFNKIYQSIFKERIIILLPILRISKQIFQKVFVKKHADGESEEEEVVCGCASPSVSTQSLN